MPQHILKKTRQQAVVSYIGSGSNTIDLADLVFKDETLDRANSSVTITHAWFNFVTAGNIQRSGGATVLEFGSGSLDNWDMAQTGGFVLNQNANANIVVNMGASAGTIILTLHKSAGYISPDYQTLTLANKI